MSILTKIVPPGLPKPLNESPTGDMKQPNPKASITPWSLMAITCVLLGISGGVRIWRELQFRSLAQEKATCPFPLEDLPRDFKDWSAVEGSDNHLDPEIARIAGSSDHIIRTYRNKNTGEEVMALILYGLANSVFGHTPEVCFPAVGYKQSRASENRKFEIPGSTASVQYRSAYFTKNIAGIGAFQEEEVYYTFLHNGEWLPALASRWKSFRYHPSIFKIQLQRKTSRLSTEDRVADSLLTPIVQEINSRVSQNKTLVATQTTPGQ
jgi:hypothetical protein